MNYIIAYDIKNTSRRTRIARYLEKIGRRIQKSVFVVDIQRRQLKKLQCDLAEISERKGVIHIFYLCNGCLKKAQFMGEEPPDCMIF